jgi:imidazolonepropionase-like amidohydrolase
VVIDGKRITQVSAGRQAPAGATIISLAGQTCLPGLIDSHTHLTGQTSPTGYSDQFRWNIADYAIRSTNYARVTLLAGFHHGA